MKKYKVEIRGHIFVRADDEDSAVKIATQKPAEAWTWDDSQADEEED